jgi:UDP-N-acetylglucosamine--N-acetylmuramyl-(pentapeptide) pyrophosphoryl-undecaprenol N-acetylglucosamine transferase
MRVLIAGGGTGGHVFPGLAIAEEFRRRDKDAKILFVGTRKGIEARVVPREGFEIRFVTAEGLVGRGIVKGLVAVMKLGPGIFTSLVIIRSFMADVVIGVGGYASFPLILAARILKVKSAIQEQNTIPGQVNRVAGRWVDSVFVAFEQALCYFPAGKGIVTGNPVRRRLLEQVTGRKSDTFTLLIIGGSQGSEEINRVMLEALDHLVAVKDSLAIIHQTGEKDYPRMADAYRQKGFNAEVYPFITDMERVYPLAHLVVCRAGALTLTELMIFRKASILIPFPFAANNHQAVNACELTSRKAARMILSCDVNGPLFAQEIINLFKHPEAIAEMERRVGELARPDAAERIVDVCYRMTGGETHV